MNVVIVDIQSDRMEWDESRECGGWKQRHVSTLLVGHLKGQRYAARMVLLNAATFIDGGAACKNADHSFVSTKDAFSTSLYLLLTPLQPPHVRSSGASFPSTRLRFGTLPV